MQTNHNTRIELGTAPGTIASLSLCMVISAWGALISPAWREWWAIFGAIGFVSSIALYTRNRRRRRSILQEHQRQVTQWVERKLDNVVSGMRATDEIGTAVNRIVRGTAETNSQSSGRRKETRTRLHKQITLMPVPDPTASKGESAGGAFIGFVRDISTRHVGLVHDRPVDRGSFLLSFDLDGGDRICFIADLLWCEAQEDGDYISGAKLMKLVSSDFGRVTGPALSSCECGQEMCA